jgi:hypothetical protein
MAALQSRMLFCGTGVPSEVVVNVESKEITYYSNKNIATLTGEPPDVP